LGVFILQDSQGKEARFRFANEAVSRITGYDADELLSKSLPELAHPDSLPAIMERLRLTQRGEILDQGIEIKMVRKDGVPIIARGSFALSSHEKKTATIGFLRDITKKKMGERALWRSQRLASIGRLAAEIAHEINNPLTSVITFSKLLNSIMQQEPFPARRISELRTYIGYLQNETERCANISRNLLDFSRQAKIDVRDNDINAILERTLTILKHRASLDKIEICTHYASSIPPVSCDFSRLQQAFINILWNAIEAMPQGGVLTVTTAIDPQQETIEVHIIDTGTGIPEENLERVFEPFFTTKDEGKGVGLGLSVAYGVIRQHHGEIQIQSKVGEGTQVTVQLPAGPRALSIEEQSDEYLFGIKGIPGWENNAPRGKGRLEAENHKE
jgi:PAS domain S-box-containing protein